MAGASGWLLRRTDLGEGYVLALAGLVVLAAAVVAYRRPGLRAIRAAFIALSAACLLVPVIFALVCFRLHQWLCEEDHVIEWLTADFLLAAWLIGLVATVRLSRRGRPSPTTLLLTAGCFVAFWRELEWGQPLFGEKVWYSRNLLRLRAYLSPEYFERFRESLHLSQRPFYAAHLAISLGLILTAAIVIFYLIRHRRVLLRELRRLGRSEYGRYFLLGVGVYAVSQVMGAAFRHLLRTDWLTTWREQYGVSHRVLDEPLELWGALCFLVSMLVLWKTRRAYLPAAGRAPRPQAAERLP